MRLFSCFRISIFLPVFILITFIFGIEKRILFLYFIGFIHELFHVLSGTILGGKISKFSLNIFGFSADIEEVEYLDFYKQIIIYLAGPISYFISAFIIFIMYKYSLINEYYMRVYNEYNLTFNLFNLLPIYPLDGGRVLDTLYRKILPIQSTLKIRKIWSILGIIPLVISLILNHQLILSIFFIAMIFMDFRNIKKDYTIYMKNRLLSNNKFPLKISNNNQFYHFNNNILYLDGEFISEDEYIIKNIVKF